MSDWHFLRDCVRVEMILWLASVDLERHIRSASATNLAFFFQPLDHVYFHQINQLVLSKFIVSFLCMSRRKLVVNVAVKTEWGVFSVLLIFIFSE